MYDFSKVDLWGLEDLLENLHYAGVATRNHYACLELCKFINVVEEAIKVKKLESENKTEQVS